MLYNSRCQGAAGNYGRLFQYLSNFEEVPKVLNFSVLSDVYIFLVSRNNNNSAIMASSLCGICYPSF